jgi:DNA-binding NarL/FixJ family response regulator
MADGARPRVLLVDDNPGVLTALERFLAPDCDVVGTVREGAAVCEASRRLQPDVIVLDLNMPDVTGLEVCRQIAQTDPHARVILLSGDVRAAIREEGLGAGACAVIPKDQVTELLLPSIETALRGRIGTGRP